jgi:hypothetical protein
VFGYADYIGLAVRRDGTTPEIAAGFQTCYDYATFSATDETITVTGVDLTVGAGSHTYTVWMYVSDSGSSSYLWNTNLSVLEINN